MDDQNSQMAYQHIVVALELVPKADRLPLQKAHALSQQIGAKLTLLQVVESVSGFGAAYSVPASVEVEQKLLDSAKRKMARWAKRFDIPSAQRIIATGGVKPAILAEVERLSADLLVIGSHGRHGVALLLGSTADTALHHANCDILAVRVDQK